LASGTISTASVFPREIVKAVLKHKSTAVILAHSHPSGNPEPSKDDILITRKLRDALATVDVQVHDHLVLSGNKNEFTSMADRGLL
jgi:DNA repair protein RadC